MGRIIIPSQGPDPQKLAKNKALQERYDSDPDIKAMADMVHSSRLMAGPACSQCIEIAISKVESRKKYARQSMARRAAYILRQSTGKDFGPVEPSK